MAQAQSGIPTFESELVSLIPQLRAFGRSLAGDPVLGDDLAQETLSKAWASQDSFELGTNMKAWAYMILRNQFYSIKRRDWRSVDLDPRVAEDTVAGIEDPTGPLQLDELRRALAMLSESQREALILIGAAGLSYDEAAEITGVAVGTVKSRVSRARDALALIYAEGQLVRDDLAPSEAAAAIFRQVDEVRQRHFA